MLQYLKASAALAAPAALAALAVFAAPAGLAAQDSKSRGHLLVEIDWLAEHFEDPGIVLIQVGPEDSFAAGHIPGAVPLGFDAISAPHDHDDPNSLMLEMPDAAALQEVIRNLGIDEDSRIVVYWADEWVTPTSRVMLTLDYVGLGDRSMMLDGGLEAWTAAGLPVTTEATEPTPGSFTIRPRKDLIVSADWVREHAGTPGVALVDARAPAFYDGVRDSEAGAGHIPGALNVDWRTLLEGEPASWKDAEQLAAIFEAAGVEPGDTVVGYCHVGQYATAMLFAARTLGYDVRLYDGSMQEWGGILQYPLDKRETAAKKEAGR